MKVHTIFGWSFMTTHDLSELMAKVSAERSFAKREKDYSDTEIGTLRNQVKALERDLKYLSQENQNYRENYIPKPPRDAHGRFVKK